MFYPIKLVHSPLHFVKISFEQFDPEGPTLQPPVKPSFTFNDNQTNQKSKRN